MQQKNNYLEKLRAKPIEHRRMIAIGSSLALTSLIVIIWSISLFSNTSSESDKTESMANVSNNLSTFSLIKDQFSEMMKKNPFDGGDLIAPQNTAPGTNNIQAVEETNSEEVYSATSSADEQAVQKANNSVQ